MANMMKLTMKSAFLFYWTQYSALAFSSHQHKRPTDAFSLGRKSGHFTCPSFTVENQRIGNQAVAPLFSAPAPKNKQAAVESEEEDLDFSALQDLSEELLGGGDGAASTPKDEDNIDKGEMLSALDDAPVGTLTLDQISFLRDTMMSYFVSNDQLLLGEEKEEIATIVERLLFRLLDEWQAAVASITYL
jgi:hypothetical protein